MENGSNKNYFEELMERYKTDNLAAHITRQEFRDGISEFEKMKLDGGEGERDLSYNFTWGHTHDFGDFKVLGRMGNRHTRLFEHYSDFYNFPETVKGKRVLDIGVWTGGSSLVLAAMGAKEVVAIDEVAMYVDTLKFLAESFGVENITPLPQSLYRLLDASVEEAFGQAYEFEEKPFEVVHFAGVLYHLTDMIDGLRIIYEHMVPGGTLLMESHTIRGNDLYASYQGTKGWNWWFPTVPLVEKMLRDVGFEKIKRKMLPAPGRAVFVAERMEHKHLMRCGRP